MQANIVNVLRWLNKKYAKNRTVCLDGSKKEPSRQTSTKQHSGNGDRSCKSNWMCENTFIQNWSNRIAIGTNVPPTCRVEGACRVAQRLTISNRHLEETALQARNELVETEIKGCMDETVETESALERKTGNLLGEGSHGHFKKEEHGGWKGQRNSGQAGGRCI